MDTSDTSWLMVEGPAIERARAKQTSAELSEGGLAPNGGGPEAGLEAALDRGRFGRALAKGIAWVLLAILVSGLLSRVVGSQSWLDCLTLVGIYALCAQGSNVIVGVTGQLALCPNAFMMVGAYIAAIAVQRWHLDPWLALTASAFAAGAAAVIVGAPSLRLRGFFFGMVTLTFSSFAIAVANGWLSVTGGSDGLTGLPPFGGSILALNYHFWLPLTWGCAAAASVVLALVLRSRFGDNLRAVHKDEELASAFGINIYATKLAAFVSSGLMAGLAGALLALYDSLVTPDEFGPTLAITILMMVFLGGADTVAGPLIGALVVTRLQLSLASTGQWSEVIFAAVLVVVLVLLPRGLVSLWPAGLQRHRHGVCSRVISRGPRADGRGKRAER